jgi:hypothetical protein
MQKTRLIFQAIALLTLSFQFAWAQPVSGFQGKRFILKSDVVPYAVGRIGNLELEAVTSRSFALCLGTSFFMGTSYFSDPDNQELDTAASSMVMVEFHIRRYATGAHVAPLGTYVELGAGAGKLTNTYSLPGTIPTDSVESAPLAKLGFTLGVQRILLRRLTIDFNVNFSYNVKLKLTRFRGPEYRSLGQLIYEDSGGGANDFVPYVGAALKIGVLLF